MQKYFADFVSMYSELEKSRSASGESRENLSDRFFGKNAVDYLGLRDGRTRQRLTDFYTACGVKSACGVKFGQHWQPAWMRKI